MKKQTLFAVVAGILLHVGVWLGAAFALSSAWASTGTSPARIDAIAESYRMKKLMGRATPGPELRRATLERMGQDAPSRIMAEYLDQTGEELSSIGRDIDAVASIAPSQARAGNWDEAVEALTTRLWNVSTSLPSERDLRKNQIELSTEQRARYEAVLARIVALRESLLSVTTGHDESGIGPTGSVTGPGKRDFTHVNP